jgi:hypothetical protein
VEISELLRSEGLDPNALGPVVGFEENGVLQLRVPGGRAFDLWQRLSARAGESGHWPVITRLTEPDRLTELAAPHENDTEPFSVFTAGSKALAQAQGLPFEEWLRRQRDPLCQAEEYERKAAQLERLGRPGAEPMINLYRQFAEDWRGRPAWHFDPAQYPWPEQPVPVLPPGQLHLLFDFPPGQQRVIVPEAVLLFVPTPDPWEVPAYVLFGGFNSCPPPAVHASALRWLQDRYGGQPAAVGDGTIEVVVERRPTSRDEALRLAENLATYAEEVLACGYRQTRGQVAAYLMECDRWGFWWD